MVSIIVAYTNNYAIGKNNELLFHISEDLKRFKKLTTGKTVIMGRKTFESLPNGALPQRRNIVITHSNITYKDTEVVHSLKEAIDLAGNEDVFIIGGGSIYNEAINIADKIYATEIYCTISDADTFFPIIDRKKWHIDNSSDLFISEKYKLKYKFIDYKRTIE